MISHIRGTLLEASSTSVVIECSGIGFELGISQRTASELPGIGEDVSLFVRTRITSESITLYAFSTNGERRLYDCLVAITGVGPKMAMAILSTYSAQELYSIVMTDNASAMSKIPGVGKKTAQRLNLELKSVFEKDKSFSTIAHVTDTNHAPVYAPVPDALHDASSALLSMGFTSSEIELALKDIDVNSNNLEKILQIALRRLGMSS